MASIIVTGATGTVGSAVLTNVLASPAVSKVTVLARRAPAVTHDKLQTILLPSDEYPKGFDELPPSLVEKLKGHEAVIWALGISQTQVKKEEYIRITYDYTMAAANAFKALGTPDKPFRFVFVSGMGVDQGGNARTLFGQTKGRAEKELVEAESASFKTVIMRPGGIIPTPERRQEMTFFQRNVISAASWIVPSQCVQSTQLGSVAIQLALGKGWEHRNSKEHWLDNSEILKMAAQLG